MTGSTGRRSKMVIIHLAPPLFCSRPWSSAYDRRLCQDAQTSLPGTLSLSLIHVGARASECRPHRGRPQGSPALTMTPMLSHLATVRSPAHYCSLVANLWGLLRI